MASLVFVLVHVFLPPSSGLSPLSHTPGDIASDDVSATQSTNDGGRRRKDLASPEKRHSFSQDILRVDAETDFVASDDPHEVSMSAVINSVGGVQLSYDPAARPRVSELNKHTIATSVASASAETSSTSDFDVLTSSSSDVEVTASYGTEVVDAGSHRNLKRLVGVNASTALRSLRLLYSAQHVQLVIFAAIVWLRPCYPALLAAIVSLLADACAQFRQQRAQQTRAGHHRPWDVKRSATFALFGAVYIGMIKRNLVLLLPPPRQKVANVPLTWQATLLAQGHMCEFRMMDSFLVVVFIGLPVFYLLRSAVETGISCTAVVGAIHRYRLRFVMDVLVGTLLWLPVDIAYITTPPLSMSLLEASQFAWSFVLSLQWCDSLDSAPTVIVRKAAARKAVAKLETAAAANMAS